MNLEQLAARQAQLAQSVHIPPLGQGYKPQPGDLIFALDVQYAGDRACVGVDVSEWQGRPINTNHTRGQEKPDRTRCFSQALGDKSHRPKPLLRDEHNKRDRSEGFGRTGGFAAAVPVQVPYIPRFFCFREGPPLLETITAIRERFGLTPELILVDGHGIAHPRRFGIACWVGIKTGMPTIGCAKKTLLNYVGEMGKKRGDSLPIEDQGEVVGDALTTRDNVKPVFVSPGHGINLDTAVEIILALCKYRIPDPLRRADQVARACAKGQIPPGITDLGKLA